MGRPFDLPAAISWLGTTGKQTEKLICNSDSALRVARSDVWTNEARAVSGDQLPQNALLSVGADSKQAPMGGLQSSPLD